MTIARLHFRSTWKAHIYDIQIVLIWFHFELPQEQHFDYFTLHHSGILWHSVREEPGVIFYLGWCFCCLMRVISRNIIWQFQFSYSYSHFVFTFSVHFHRYSSFVAQQYSKTTAVIPNIWMIVSLFFSFPFSLSPVYPIWMFSFCRIPSIALYLSAAIY